MEKKKITLESRRRMLSRRAFIGGTLATLAGAGMAQAGVLLGRKSMSFREVGKIKKYRTLGRTGFKVSDIGFGSSELTEGALLDALLDAGVNYIDTAEAYSRGGSERLIGEVIKNRDRKKIFITTKLVLREKDGKRRIVERTNRCLARLQTDYVDCLMIHLPRTLDHLKNPQFHIAVRELKALGKVRFTGLSHHGTLWDVVPETMEKIALSAIDDGRFDVLLFAYNFMQRKKGEMILRACRERNVGSALMKTNPVLNYKNMQKQLKEAEAQGRKPAPHLGRILPGLKERIDSAETFLRDNSLTDPDSIRAAAVKFVISHPDVNTACLTIKNFDDLDFFISLSGKKFTPIEKKSLAIYEDAMGGFYCRHACGECESKCPQRVPVNTIMRYYHYFWGQGREKYARLKYAALPSPKPDLCASCDCYCQKACPYDVPIRDLLVLAHHYMTLA